MKSNSRLKRIAARTAFVATGLCASLVVNVVPAQAAYVPINAAHPTLQNIAKSWTVIAIAGEDSYHGEARMYGTNGYTNWKIQNFAPNGHTITEYFNPKRCLDSNKAGEAYGLRCNGGNNQRWFFNHLGKQRDSFYQREWDVYEIINKATGRCLDGNGQKAYTLPCNGGNYQHWFMINVGV